MFDAIKDNITTIISVIVVYLAGVGAGAAITDAINKKGDNNER